MVEEKVIDIEGVEGVCWVDDGQLVALDITLPAETVNELMLRMVVAHTGLQYPIRHALSWAVKEGAPEGTAPEVRLRIEHLGNLIPFRRKVAGPVQPPPSAA